MIVLFCEHIMAYLFGVFRNWELKKHGKPNSLNIETAPCETRLKVVEIVVDVIIIIIFLIHFIIQGKA